MKHHHHLIILQHCDEFRYPMDNDDNEDDDGDDDDVSEIHDYQTFDNRQEIVEEILTNTIYSLTSMDEEVEHSVQMFVFQCRNTKI